MYLNKLRILANSHECVLNWNITSPAPNPTSIGRHTDTAIKWCYPLPTKMLRNHLAPAVCYARPGGCVVIIPWDRYIRSLVNSRNCRLEVSPFRTAKAVLLLVDFKSIGTPGNQPWRQDFPGVPILLKSTSTRPPRWHGPFRESSRLAAPCPSAIPATVLVIYPPGMRHFAMVGPHRVEYLCGIYHSVRLATFRFASCEKDPIYPSTGKHYIQQSAVRLCE